MEAVATPLPVDDRDDQNVSDIGCGGELAAVRDLLREGRLAEAEALVAAVVNNGLPPGRTLGGLRLTRSAILCLCNRADEALADAEAILADSGYPDTTFAGAKMIRLQALLGKGDFTGARVEAESILAGRDRPGDDEALSGALTTMGQLAWKGGRPAESLTLFRAASRRAEYQPEEVSTVYPRLALASRLVSLGQCEAATDTLGALAVGRDSLWGPATRAIHARLCLVAGRLDEAINQAEAVAADLERGGMSVLAPMTWSTLAIGALLRGQVPAAAQHVARCWAEFRGDDGGPDMSAAMWAEARVVEAQVGAAAAFQRLGPMAEQPALVDRLIVDDPANAAWWVRVALEAGERQAAAAIARSTERLATDNEEFAVLSAAHAHVQGLLASDAERLARAAGLYPQPWAKASATEDAGVVMEPSDRGVARAYYEAALAGYLSTTANRDGERVQRRLRHLDNPHRSGGRRGRPLTGWSSLTETELRVIDLVAEGLTNAEAAERLFLSRHTVDFHLRQVFRKLGIRSRVELARLVIMRANGTPAGEP
jgi:DNA-binding CsgD family transcriptional regulator